MPGGKISKRVRAFFSNENQLLFAYRTSRKIKKIRENLDRIARDRNQFGLSDVYVPVERTEVKTGSYVHQDSIIGREVDKEVIIDMLSLGDLDSSIDNVSFVSIVGMGGIGKTALAQLLYGDNKIEFKLKLWVCVSDVFSMEEFLRQMLKSATEKDPGDLGFDGLQNEVRRCIGGEKYFLILDDMWNENRDEWLKLRGFLCLGARGSRVVVTTRSEKVAKAIGDDPMYKLGGLSFDDSLRLFKSVAFSQGNSQVVDDVLVEEIVRKCAEVPLAIRVVGSMLYGQDRGEWELFQRLDLAEMDRDEERIMPILKYSYYQLTPQLKSCFSYCALFPKDYVIDIELLTYLWSAQGYLMGDGMSIEYVGKKYFSILLQRCFFQDIKHRHGKIKSCKMHDLIHVLAQQVAGKDLYLMGENSTSHFDSKTHHLSISVWRYPLLSQSDTFAKVRGLRTFLRPSDRQLDCESQMTKILGNCQRLRALDLHNFSLKAVPSTINNLVHLRYLDLSDNEKLEMLPTSIANLHNLQVLKLSYCSNLKELPNDLRDLVNLRHLDTSHCIRLTHMPSGMDNLTGLCTLTRFVLGGETSKKTQVGQLSDLLPLINLTGDLNIVFRNSYSYNATNVEEGAYLSTKIHIKALSIEEEDISPHKEAVIVDERLLERLEPHCDLSSIEIKGYKCIKLPRWLATLAVSLPQLVRVSLQHFHKLQHLPSLSQLQKLKSLVLKDMPNVEFMEYYDGAAAVPSFPSLESLVLENCPSMKSFPECQHVKSFHLCGLNEALTFCRQRDGEANSSTSDSNKNSAGGVVFDLLTLEIDNLGQMKSLFGESIQSIHSLRLQNMEESLSIIVEEYQRYATSIKLLEFSCCPNLKNLLDGGIEHLTNLKHLEIEDCPNLGLEEEEGIPWKALHALRVLHIRFLPQLVNLPKGLQYLTSLEALIIQHCNNLETLPEFKSLRSLNIHYCPKLKSLPESILPSLKSLRIAHCDGLMELYREPNGKDWSKISHILYLDLIF